MYQMTLTSIQYTKFRSRPNTQPLGHVADTLCYVFIYFWLKSRKIAFKLFFFKYNVVISFSASKNIQIDISYMFLCSLFEKVMVK